MGTCPLMSQKPPAERTEAQLPVDAKAAVRPRLNGCCRKALPYVMNVAAAASISCLMSVSFWAGRADASSDRNKHIEDRNRAAVSSICRGCITQPRSATRARAKPHIGGTTIPRVRDLAGQRGGRRGSGSLPMNSIPLTSDAEAQIRSTNRALEAQQQRLQIQQQFQFEINQLRWELQRDRLY